MLTSELCMNVFAMCQRLWRDTHFAVSGINRGSPCARLDLHLHELTASRGLVPVQACLHKPGFAIQACSLRFDNLCCLSLPVLSNGANSLALQSSSQLVCLNMSVA